MEIGHTRNSTRVARRVIRAFKPRQTLDSQNAWNLYGDIAWFGVLNGIITSFLAVYTIRLGGSDLQIGLLSALPALVTIFVSIPGAHLVEQEKRPLSVLIVTAILHRAGYLAIGLVPFFIFTHQSWWVVVLSGLLTIPQAVANVAFTTMFGDVVEPARRAHVVSVRNVLIGITSTATALAGGQFLDRLAFPVNYQILFTLGFAASLVSAYYLTRIRMPGAARPVAAARTSTVRGLRNYLAMLHDGPGFTRFTITSFVFQWGLFFAVPLYSIYWVRSLHASDGWVGAMNTVASATTIIFYPLWGRLMARRGNRIAMIVTTAGLAAYPLLMAVYPSLEWMLFVSFWGGAFLSGQAMSFFNGLLEVCPEENRAARIAAYNTLANLAAFLSPLISTALLNVFSVEAMLIVGAGLRLFGSFLIWQQRVLAPESHSPNRDFFGKMESVGGRSIH